MYSRNNLPNKTKDEAYVINLDEHKDTSTHWIALFRKKNEIVYFDSFVLSIYLKKLKNFLVIET